MRELRRRGDRKVSVPSARHPTELPPVVGVGSGPLTTTPTPSLRPAIKLPPVQPGYRQWTQFKVKKSVTFPGLPHTPTPATSGSTMSSIGSTDLSITGSSIFSPAQRQSSRRQSLPPVPPAPRRDPFGSRSVAQVISQFNCNSFKTKY